MLFLIKEIIHERITVATTAATTNILRAIIHTTIVHCNYSTNHNDFMVEPTVNITVTIK